MSRRTDLHGNPQAFWARMCALTRTRQGFTVPEIHARYTAGRYQLVRAYVLACAKAGVIEADGTRTTAQGRRATLYRVKVTGARDPIARACALPAQPGPVQEQIWVAMRGLGLFEERELAVQASTDDIAVDLPAVRKYARALLAAGYLQELPRRGSGGRRVLRLAPSHNTGPQPPAVLADGVVFDRNRNAVIGQGDAA